MTPGEIVKIPDSINLVPSLFLKRLPCVVVSLGTTNITGLASVPRRIKGTKFHLNYSKTIARAFNLSILLRLLTKKTAMR